LEVPSTSRRRLWKRFKTKQNLTEKKKNKKNQKGKSASRIAAPSTGALEYGGDHDCKGRGALVEEGPVGGRKKNAAILIP